MPRQSDLGLGDGIAASWLKEDGEIVGVLMRVRDERGKYAGKRFPVVSFDKEGNPNVPLEASRWAKNKRREFTAGRDSAGKVGILELGKAYVTELRGSGANKSYADHIELVCKALDRARINDLKAEWFPARFKEWLTDLKADWWEAVSDTKAKDGEGRFRFGRKDAMDVSPSTKNKMIREVKSVVNYALSLPSRPLPYNPLAGMKDFKEADQLKALFTVSELREAVSDEHSKDPSWLPCAMLVYTGCRAQEAMHLRWEWIDWANDVITLKLRPEFAVKGSRERLITLQPELRAILHPMAKPHGWIIDNEAMRSNGTMEARERTKKAHPDYTPGFQRYLKRIGIAPKERTAHSTRHCFITLQLAMEVPAYQVMATVGHSQINTTLGYAGQRQQYAKEVERWHPRGQMFLRRDPPAHQATPAATSR